MGNVTTNYDLDGIDKYKCNEPCRFKDVDKDTCLFEACIFKQFPFSMPHHDTITLECDICGDKYTMYNLTDGLHPFIRINGICPNCKLKLKSLVAGGDSV